MSSNINDKLIFAASLSGVENLVHGFTLRRAGDMLARENSDKLLISLQMDRFCFLQQVHGGAAARPEAGAHRPRADAWAGVPMQGEALCVLTADCLPVLMCHPPSRAIGAAHAGWRGLAGGVLKNTLKAMNVPAEELAVVLGPCIGPCCYQVGEDVARIFSPLLNHEKSTVNGRIMLDLAWLARRQLLEAGVLPDKIQSISLCASCNRHLFFSFRGEKTPKRMAAFIGWR